MNLHVGANRSTYWAIIICFSENMTNLHFQFSVKSGKIDQRQ